MHLDKGNKVDEVLREKFESYQSELSPQVWSQLIDEVDRGNRARGLYLALGAFMLAMLTLFGGTYLQADVKAGSNPSTGQEFLVQENFIVDDELNHSAKNEYLVPEREASEIESRSAEQSPAPKVEEIDVIKPGAGPLDNASSQPTEFVKPQNFEFSETSSPEVNHTMEKKEEEAVISPSRPTETVMSTNPIPSVTKEQHDPVEDVTDIVSNDKLLPVDIERTGQEIMALLSWDIETLALDRQLSVNGNEGPLPPLPDISFDRLRKWSVHASVGPSVNYRTFNSPDSEFTNHKNESDRSLLSANAELLIHYRPSEQWMFSLGVGKLNMGERYAFTLNQQTHRFTNEYHYITLPVRVRHRIWDISNTYDLFIGTGAQIGFLQEGVSSWVDLASEQAVTHSNKGAESPFRENVISGEFDIMLTADLTDRVFISLQERATYSLNSIYKTETKLDQRPFSFDTLLGIGIRF